MARTNSTWPSFAVSIEHGIARRQIYPACGVENSARRGPVAALGVHIDRGNGEISGKYDIVIINNRVYPPAQFEII